MRIGVIFLGIACCTFALSQTSNQQQPGNQKQTQRDSGSGASFIFAGIEPALRKQSRVPPRLPGYLPGVDREHSIDAILESATDTGYQILLAVEPDCEGQHRCSYGSVLGNAFPLKLDASAGVPVTLRHGVRGLFIDSVCGAYCGEAYVEWQEKGFYYAIGIKAGRKEELIRAANSAIP